MKKEFKLDIKKLPLLYHRYKDSQYFLLLIIVLIIFCSFLLFLQLVIPQMQSWFSIRDEVMRTNERISVINSNINHMNAINKEKLEEQVTTSTTALPIEKNFGTIIAALTDSALSAGVTLDDYTFQVGKVASVEGQLNVFGQKELSQVNVTVILSGSFQGVNRFLTQLQNKLPLSEVLEVDGDILTTTVTVQFYQKQFPKIVFKDDVPIPAFSPEQLSLLDKLKSWQPPVSEEEPTEASESAENVPLF